MTFPVEVTCQTEFLPLFCLINTKQNRMSMLSNMQQFIQEGYSK
ncbi:hypothetical protein NTGZN8_100045 [Candidatus Nitrotoga fabula]|uniref:Uncharacterized protein n=1 Tax=Candidatus Nitrotoga fabula TaxID=2182327 RepID=A0A916BAE1_9PROT|nr:hypothetical protein NTGZN8_100045 [Candidatus Nitrotoga fabula]